MGIKHSISLPEPQRGKDLLVQMNESFVGCDSLVRFAPILTDGLVFVYPVMLVIRYLYGMQVSSNEMKVGAIYVFLSAGFAAFVNIFIQYFIDKERPEGYIDNAELLIMDHLPTAPFPSDHAAVSMAVGVATFLWSWKYGYSYLTLFGGFLIAGSLVMSLARVGVAIHRPTDIIAGSIVGLCVAYILYTQLFSETLLTSFIQRLIGIQEWIIARMGF